MRVLAVDDEPMNLELLERSLRRNYDVVTAESPDEALERLRGDPDIAVILSDYRMPGMNGAEFLAETIKTHPATRRVMITGYADADNVISAVNSGQIHYLIKKPFTRESLLVVVDRLIESYWEERQSAAGGAQDALTGLSSHGTFQEQLREELQRSQEEERPLTLLYGDIDEFASLNDELGYSTGDGILRRVAEVIQNGESGVRLGERGVIARFGGEEFAVLLPETPKETALQQAEILREAISSAQFPGGRSVTLSFGLAGFPEDAAQPTKLVSCAQRAERQAKREGGNRVHPYVEGDGEQPGDCAETAVDVGSRPGTGRAGFYRPAERFPAYHACLDRIISALERHRTVACLFVDLSQLRRIEMEYGVAQHTELFAAAGQLLERLRGDKLRRDDLVCRTEDADAYVCFLSPPRRESGTPVDLEAIAARVEEEIQRGLAREMEDLTRERPRVTVGFSRVLNNPMMRPERLIVRVVAEARRSAVLQKERTSHRDKALLQEIILHEQMAPVYQPIVQLESGDMFGFESLTRGPRDSRLETPTALFSVADDVDLTFELDRACFRGALRGAVGLEPVHRLFVNLLPMSFYDSSFIEQEVSNLLEAASLTPANVVFEITERLAIENFVSFRQALANYTAMGFGVAIDDVGTRHSNLETVMALRPHFIKISDVLTRGVSQSTVKREMLSSLQRIAEAIDAVVVAEGIENPDDLAVLCELGVRYGQGFYLARPGPPFPRLRPTVRRAVRAMAQTPKEQVPTGDIVEEELHAEEEFAEEEQQTRIHAPSIELQPESPAELDGSESIRAAGSSPGIRAAPPGEEDAEDGDGVVQEWASSEETQPRLKVEAASWEPLRAEDLGGSAEDVPLIRSLRESGDEEPAHADADEGDAAGGENLPN